MTTTLLYVRHADVFNPENVMYGRLPRFRLSDYGRYFAEKTAAFLEKEPIAAFYTSPLLRARQTTRILARRHTSTPIHVRAALSEVRTSWQGTAFRDLPSGKTVYETRQEDKDESIEDVWRRMKALADTLAEQHSGQTVVCVSHGDPIKILSIGLQGRTLDLTIVREPEPARGSVTRLDYTEHGATPTITYTDVVGGPAFQKVASLNDLPPGSLTRIERDHADILLVRTVSGAVHAVSNRCPHMRAHLHEGALEDDIITCPLHGTQFRATNGEVVRPPQCGVSWTASFGEPGRALSPIEAGKLPTYEVRIEGDDVLMRKR